jgi:hypothetical protein
MIKPFVAIEEYDRTSYEPARFEIFIDFNDRQLMSDYRTPAERNRKLKAMRKKAKEFADLFGVKVKEFINKNL